MSRFFQEFVFIFGLCVVGLGITAACQLGGQDTPPLSDLAQHVNECKICSSANSDAYACPIPALLIKRDLKRYGRLRPSYQANKGNTTQ